MIPGSQQLFETRTRQRLIPVVLSLIAAAALFAVRVESLTPSPDGTSIPPATQIIDAAGAAWSIGSNFTILRNGAQAAGGLGSRIQWSNNTIWVYGTDGNWWQWTGAGWIKSTPSSSGTSTGASPEGATVPTTASQIVDRSGVVWTIAPSLAILRNGSAAAGGYGTKILWQNSTIYVFGTDSNWWQWTGSGWIKSAPSTVGGTTTTDASPDGTIVPTTASQIIDSSRVVWTIAPSAAILRNGSAAAGGYGTKILWQSGVIYVFGTDSNWWQWTGSGWVKSTLSTTGGTTSSGTTSGGTTSSSTTTTTGIYNAHPRIWYGPKLSTLRAKMGANDADWLATKQQADTLLSNTVAPYSRSNCWSNAICYTYEGTGWESAAASLTFVAAVTGNRAYCDKALEIVGVMNAATAAGNLDPIQADSGFPSRSAAKALGLTYDTCGQYMDAATKQATFATMNAWFDWVKTSGFDATGPAQSNYFGGHLLGMGIIGLASAGENPRGQEIADWARRQFDATVNAAFTTGLFQGGYLIEGATYGANHYVRLLSYMAAVKSATNEDLVAGRGYGPRLVRGLIYQFKPNRWQVGDEADMPGDWVGVMDPTLLMMLPALCAGTPEAGYAQWLFQHVLPVPGTVSRIDPAMRLLWYDPTVAPADYRSVLPVTYRSAGDNHVIARTDWTDNAVWTSFAAGSEWWTGHQLRWAGHLTIARGQDYLLVNSGQWKGANGYTGSPSSFDVQNWRANTLDYPTTWSGGYQGGQGAWGASQVTGGGSGNDYLWTRADITSAYGRVTDVTLAVRTVVTFSSGTSVVFTRVMGSQTKTLNWHGNRNGAWQCSGSVCTSVVGTSKLMVTALGHTLTMTPDPASTTDWSTVTYRASESDSRPDATFIDVLQPTAATAVPETVQGIANGAQVGWRTVTFDMNGMPTVN